MPEAPYLSVVIPCWNEQKNLEGGVLDQVHRYLARQAFSWEVIVVDDGSTDASRSLVEAAIRESEHTSLCDVPHGGKPAAVWAGIQQARGDEDVRLQNVKQPKPQRTVVAAVEVARCSKTAVGNANSIPRVVLDSTKQRF